MLTAQQLSNGLMIPMLRAQKWVGFICRAMEKFGIDTPLRQAHFLAQVGHESMGLFYVQEIASGKAYNGRKDLGNTEPEALAIAKANNTTAGEFYKGHGLIENTGYYNHLDTGKALGLDLAHHPELLLVPINAAFSAGYFWQKHNLNAPADDDDIIKVTRIVNGGDNGLANRIKLLSSMKSALGI